MLRIESYVTPIILSYVDKYIKNLKPEDSNVSLWGGDAVFSNLDLKLDVLEEELKLPFSFLNGHIHELRIHVPWTKLISEPIVITINTIECILKLKDYSQTEDDSSTQSNKDSEFGCQENRRRQRRQDLETPTSYIQGLINKVINNVVVVFNNVILKYVEDDIVLSINAKTIEFRSVDYNWIPAFIDLTSDDPVLRNLVTVTDLTVCLDKRNASGKIEVYQEPFLYRCSLSCRIIRQFESVYSFQPRITRYDIFCSQLHFSLSDTQLPMFIRLLELLLALYYKQLQYQPTSRKKESFGANEDASFNEDAEENTWSSWAWAIGSSLNPFQWEEYEDSGYNHSSRYRAIFHLGVYVETATWIFKMTEISQENTFFGTSKMQFTSFLKIIQNGSFFSCVVKGLEAVNVQMGISSFCVVPVGKCICGLSDFPEEAWQTEDVHPCIFVNSGEKNADYIRFSLFDESSNHFAWNYKFVWDEAVNNVTVNSLVNRSSSFGMDYLFVMDIPAEASSEVLSEINANPESTNWNSRALCRCVFGPFKANICSSLVHRISAIVFSCQQSEYSPYPSIQTEDDPDQNAEICEEEIECLETSYPKREYVFTLIEPTVYFSWAQHEVLDVKSVLNSKYKKRCTSTSLDYKPIFKSSVPSIAGCCSRIELTMTKPMYPRVLTMAAMSMSNLSEKMLNNCHLHLVLKLHNCSLGLFNEDVMSLPVLEDFSLHLNLKSLLLPKLWVSSSHPLLELFIETDQVTIFLNMPQIHLIYYLMSSWFLEAPSPEKLQKTSLIDDAIFATKKFEMLKFELRNLDYKFLKANHFNAWNISIGQFSFALCKANKDIISIIANGPDASPNVGDTSLHISEKLFKLSIQFPFNSEAGRPIIFSAQMLKFTFVFNPQFLICLKYSLKINPKRHNEELIRKLSDIKFNSRKMWKKGFESETENVKIDSSSTTLSEAKISSRARFGLLASTQKVFTSNWRQKFIEFASFIDNLIICIEIEPWTIIFPLKSISITSNSGLANAIHRIYLTRGEKSFLEDTTVILTPYILLRNATQKDHIINSLHEVPITFSQTSFSEGRDMLPWSLKVTNFQVYTLQSAGESMKLSVIKPVSTLVTFAISPKSKGSSLSQLGVVIHLDMSPLDFRVCRRQVEMQVAILERFLNIFSFYVLFMSKDISESLSTFSETCLEKESLKEKKSVQEEFPFKTPEGKGSVHKTLNFFLNREDSKLMEPTSTNSQKDCSVLRPSVSDQFLNLTQGDGENLNENLDEDEMKPTLVSVTLWVQLTVAKASATFYVPEKEEIKKLKVEIEDFTLGVDLHQVYSKIKCKIANLSVFHYINQKNSEWLKGEKGGVVLTIGDELIRDLLILDSINRPPLARPKVLNPTSVSPHSDKHSKSCGFLSLIITKAQCKNIHSRWNQMIKKHLRDERCVKECNSPRYLCEVDLRMQSFDCVLYSPILEKFSSVFEPLLRIQLPPKHLFKTFSDSDKPSPFGSEINNRVLPLIYVHTEPIRVFIPAKDETLPLGYMHDVILMQLESLMISPHVDNPLSRLILRHDIFTAAEQARILAVPGSEVEDRQYQMDFCGFSISTGLWNDVKNLGNGRPRSFSAERMGITGENPAFEWNNYDPTKDNKNAHMYPVIARLDTRVIFAPAIIYETSKENGQFMDSLFVTGHSLEVNALTDCEFYASTSQICLINQIVLESLSMMSRIFAHENNRFGTSSSSDWLDSGVDCDVSSIEILKLSSLVEQNNANQRKYSILENFVPLEVLITGNRVSFSVYEKCTVDGNRFPLKVPQKNRAERRGKLKEKGFLLDIESTESEPSPKRVKRTNSQKSQSLTTLPMDAKLEEGYEGSEEESVYEFQLISCEGQIRIIPLVFISVSQPHTFFTIHPQKQKADVSFFDISIKSVSKGSSIKATEMKRMPHPDDYNVSWLETRPGDSHPKTGIPPAFFTFSAHNFLNKKAKISIDVGRPVRVGLSHSKWNQILHVISYIEKIFPHSSNLRAENLTGAHEKKSGSVNGLSFLNMLKFKLKQLENISFCTSQIIINAEILSNTNSKYELLTSLSAFSLNLLIIRKKLKQKGNNFSEEFISELNLDCFIKGLQFKTSCYNLALHPLMKPWSVNSEVKFVWYQWKVDPYIKIKINSEVLQIELGPETLYSLQQITAALHNLLLWFSSEKKNLSNDYDVNKPLNELYSDSFFQDDLRAGVFEYIDCPPDNSSSSFPKPYQVVFDKNKNTMVWCYPEPRALTKVEIFPVPFVSANVVNDRKMDESLFILCSLQYFDEIRNCFVTYKRFKLSESHICSLDLPGIHELNLLAVSIIWRVCINSDDGDDDTNQNVKRTLFLSPEALAACIRVDSLFSVSILPIVQIVFIISKWNLTFVNHLDATGSKLILPLEEFKLDDSFPTIHSFISFSFDDMFSKFSAWSEECFCDVSCKISSQVLNYKYLTNNLLLEPTSLFFDLSLKKHELERKCCDINIAIKRVCLNIDQSTLHTLTVSKLCWNQAFHILKNFECDSNIKYSLPIIFITNYYIANKTVESIRFGQVNTSENILLESGSVHFYSWRSQKFPAKLQICNESSRWKWCEAFMLDKEGTNIYSVTNSDGRESKFFITQKKISPTQLIVYVNGFLTIANCLYNDIDVRFCEKQFKEDSYNKASKPYNAITIKSRTLSPSFFCEPYSIRIKSSCSSVWSGEITLNQDSATVRIPLKKKKEYVSIICKIYRENVTSPLESKIMIAFCPHFIVRSHLPRPLTLFVNTPSINASQKETIKGRGNGHPLNCDPSQTHQVTLQLSPDLEVSKPPIQINRSLIDQVKNSGNDISDLSLLMEDIMKCPSERWPYVDSGLIQNDLLFADQPKINLQIEFSSLLPNCRSLVIDIRPWILIINHTSTEILLSEESSPDNVWYIPPGAVLSPPKLESTFTFGIVEAEKRYFCSSLSLSTEEHWYALKFDGRVPKIGSTNISINFEEKICFFTILSRYEENIQIMHLLPTFSVSNNTDQEFTVRAISNCESKRNIQLPLTLSSVAIPPNLTSSLDLQEVPLLMWDSLKIDHQEETKACLFLQFGLNEKYCFPISLLDRNRDLRISFTISTNDGSNEAFILTTHPKNSQVKFVIQKDLSPQMKIYNNTSVPLFVGQGSLTYVGMIEEENAPFNSVATIPPRKAIFYTFPHISASFPEILSHSKEEPKLHLAVSKLSSIGANKIFWSHGLNISEENDQFVNIQGFSDVKVSIEKSGHTAHIFIDPVNRIEISAKDIRSRIASTVVPLCVKEKEEAFSLEENCDIIVESDEIISERQPEMAVEYKYIFYFSFKSSDFTIVLREDLRKENYHLEFIRLTLDFVHLNVRPLFVDREIYKRRHLLNKNRLEVILLVEDIQIDNQMFSEGNFDFPVILVRQNGFKSSSRNSSKKIFETEKFLYISSIIDFSPLLSIQNMNITVKPLTLYLEDTLIYYSLLFFNNVSSSIYQEYRQFDKHLDEKTLKVWLPRDILVKSKSMTCPLQIGNLTIETVSVLLSIHASVKLYIALDQSPLHFKEYRRKAIITTGYSLGYNLTLHYLSNALLRAGWVVTSLDLLGNPGGFARTVGSGLRDFVQLPIEGILQGPWAFVAGITHGSMSLIKHISTGTLVSVTNLASSVARNMERLSLDEDHLTRNEANRRSKSKGISSSVLQGFSSFGLSILGAIGGLAHQPIQAVLQDDVSASQLIGSFGKGVVGVVTKPIGGVADLVVHTGQGLLQGAGWQRDLQVRVPSGRIFDSSFSNSSLKYIWKLLVSLPKECRTVICTVDAMLVTHSTSFSPVTILLTPQVLFVVNVEEDTHQQVFTLHDLKWKCHSHDPTLLYLEKVLRPVLTMNEDAEPISGCPERVADYVRSTYSECFDVSQLEYDSNDEDREDEMQIPKIKIYLSAQLRNFLTTCIEITVRSNKGQGFISQ